MEKFIFNKLATAHNLAEAAHSSEIHMEYHFDEAHVLHELKHFLPAQSALKDFIHHNPLHGYQHRPFYEAIFKASAIFGYQVTLQLDEFRQLHRDGRIKNNVLDRVIAEKKRAENVAAWREKLVSKNFETSRDPRIGKLRRHWKTAFGLDLDNLVQPLLFRVLCSYLDQGVSIWQFPVDKKGFLASVRALESNGVSSFFKTKTARKLLFEKDLSITGLLKKVVGDENYFEQYLFDQQFSHQGWSGIVSSAENMPQGFLDHREMSLRDLVLFELLLEIDTLEYRFGKNFEPLCARVAEPPTDLFDEIEKTEAQEVFAIWQDAFEWSYYDNVLAGISNSTRQSKSINLTTFQAIFCIDERECSLRRHLESVDKNCETFGAPGFFGVEFYFQPENGQFYDKLCPAPVTPKFLIKEIPNGHQRHHDLIYTPKTHDLVPGFFSTLTFGFWAAARTAMDLFRPKMAPAISNAFTHMNDLADFTIENLNPDERENGLQIGFTVQEMAARVEGQLRNMGLTSHFAPIVYIAAHGSSSANNPHHGAHDCGACSGRPGSVNARVFAFMANHPGVREVLAGRGIEIPDSTQFLGAMHDTAADEMGYFDEKTLSETNAALHKTNKAAFEKALDLNAKERSRRFFSINTRQPIERVRQAIKDRSVSLFEPRPELGHGTNSLCIVGRRSMTKGLFLDRRAFLNSYDCTTDPEGKLLAGVMRPLGIVCGGINLEYYFSRVDNYRLGAGTKLPHHVMGLFGVANSADGDLRPGLPLQMIEVHDPVRLLLIVEHFPEIVLKTIQSEPSLYEWFDKQWIHLVSVHPETQQLFYFKKGGFVPYSPLAAKISGQPDFHELVENSIKMETNRISDATKENLPVFVLN